MRWVELNEGEYNNVWNFVYKKLKFHPDVYPRFVSMEISHPAFILPAPFCIYDLSVLMDTYEKSKDRNFDNKIMDIFNDMLLAGTDDENYVYALDWQHTCFKYYLKEPTEGKNDYYMRVNFIPDGDYQFFLANDFSWGYLAHPWQQGIYAYGNIMVEYLKQHEKSLLLGLKYKS